MASERRKDHNPFPKTMSPLLDRYPAAKRMRRMASSHVVWWGRMGVSVGVRRWCWQKGWEDGRRVNVSLEARLEERVVVEEGGRTRW